MSVLNGLRNLIGLQKTKDLLILTGILFTSLSFGLVSAKADGEVDLSFSGALQNGSTSASASAVIVQPDGKILIGGAFNSAGNQTQVNIVRFNSDGTVDTSFNGPEFYSTSGVTAVSDLALQPNGKVLVGGNFTGTGGVPRPGLIRLNTDGSLDPTLTLTPNGVTFTGGIADIKILPNNQILLAGVFSIFGSTGFNRSFFIRVNPDGMID
jgi:uncharacterized delta-60 repeat protein